ncbi:DUF397 domain-containing protein [Planomonospora sp. ID82291]|uniref:DUF397 domain-containing protein n=1 Tax=Planomonospora sp. ID82291 TaxID=2738136 RepID=UPI0018C3FAD6|nr:DUF397 domain-containing protein [Planomonospora sp. ID82291]MBG0816066.1 DUF397 domain-containing protein [Planomonospora sp. ID82291]
MDLSNARWRKSSLSGNNGGNCVEVAELTGVTGGPAHTAGHPDLIAVRDSKDPDGPALFFTPAEWHAFVQGVKADEFDLG